MALASDRINPKHVASLRHVKELRERRALAEWQALEARRRHAAEAEAKAVADLRAARDSQAVLEDEVYSRLISSGPAERGELERCQIVLERLAADVERTRQALDESRAARAKAEAAAAESRTVWVRSSVVMRKWELIETDLGKARDLRQDNLSEIETEDEVALRRATGRAPQASGNQS